ncbi:hypothetical protein [Paenibacillus elgii]|uniref:hypothetical protein n=1 Tax=Paenibacillus elgii TaxID=189691 RepID=UPI0013CFFE06|nr:hypothetical protein [Paenibacillus elgii]
MKVVIQLCVWSIVFITLIAYQVMDRMLETGEHRAYAAAIIAVHDAAVVKRSDLSSGWIVFDPAAAPDSFRKSLGLQLKLNPDDLSPLPDSMWKEPFKIIGLYLLGDDKAPKDARGQPIYPYEFTANAVYRGKTIQVKETIYGPSVVGVIEFTHNVNLPWGPPPTSYKKAIYRYKIS